MELDGLGARHQEVFIAIALIFVGNLAVGSRTQFDKKHH
jgi:hypothetical protein